PAQAARQALDRAPVRAQVEERRCLDDRLLAAREMPQHGLGHRLDRLVAPEQLPEQAARLAFARMDREPGTAFADPAVRKRLLLAQLTDVDELAAVRREPERPFADEDRAAADRACHSCPGAEHGATIGRTTGVRGFSGPRMAHSRRWLLSRSSCGPSMDVSAWGGACSDSTRCS